MQRQKTMAKWLAIILLLMVAVACYVALSATIKKNSADTQATATASEGQISEQPVEPPIDKIPVYSTLPRSAERIASSVVQHVGGESDETLLTSFTVGDKTLILFATKSCEYDVKSTGIHIATIQNGYLIGVKKIAEENYLSATFTSSAIILATSTPTHTAIRQIDLNGDTEKVVLTHKYTSCLFSIDKTTKDTLMFAADESFVYTLRIDDMLSITRENTVIQAPNAKLLKQVDYGTHRLIFIDSDNGSSILMYSHNNGFTLKNRLLNSRFVQILPNSVNTTYSFVALYLREESATKSLIVSTFDRFGNPISSCVIDGAETGVLKQVDDTLTLFLKDEKCTLCSHLELISRDKISADNSLFVGDIKLINIDGSELYFRTDGITFQLVDLNAKVLFSSKGRSAQLEYVDAQSSAYIRLIFEAKSNDTLTYSAFGGYDVFLVDTTIN